MNNFSLIFKGVDDGDKEGLIAKALASASLLRIMAVISVIVTLIVAVPILMAGGLLGGVALSEVGQIGAGAATAGGIMAFGAGLLFLLVGMIGQFITLWYTGRLKKQLESREIPGLALPYVFIVLTLFSLYGSIRPEINIIGIILYAFIGYLWFVVISVVNKLSR